MPPTEYDPTTGDDTGELVEVGPGGVVESWAWVARPQPKHPLQTPFAWALIRLDGADTALLHVVDSGGPDALRTGDRVTVRFRPAAERDRGHGRHRGVRARGRCGLMDATATDEPEEGGAR